MPLEKFPEGRLVGKAQHLSYFLYRKSLIVQTDLSFVDEQLVQDNAGCFAEQTL